MGAERVSCVHSWERAFPAQGMVRAQTLRLGQRGPAVLEEYFSVLEAVPCEQGRAMRA